MTDARVILWGSDIGAVTWLEERNVGVFQYAPDFAKTNFQLSPIRMPLSEIPYEFPALPFDAFKGLPGLLADSLPDKFGNAVIDAWLASEGRTANSMNPVERLCYIGHRGMGALEFKPTIGRGRGKSKPVDIASLVDLSNQVLSDRKSLSGNFSGDDDLDTIEDIIRVGTSAGGARAKAILAWNEKTGEFHSGQLKAEPGFTQWMMKFDGVTGNKDKELSDPLGFGLIEYAYHLMAMDADITMMPCRIHKEGGRSHFMTKRFDRLDDGNKLHMQSLAAIMHYDYNQPSSYSYEQAIQTMQRMSLPMIQIEEQFRRASFNVMGRNQDDHVKNIAFLMDRDGQWRLSPAYDIAYAFNPDGEFTGRHQMSVNNKRDGFKIDDLLALAAIGNIKSTKAKKIIDQVSAAITRWSEHAEEAGVFEEDALRIEKTLRRIS